jgi:hypothetical protein
MGEEATADRGQALPVDVGQVLQGQGQVLG